jgi:hypothetical protein
VPTASISRSSIGLSRPVQEKLYLYQYDQPSVVLHIGVSKSIRFLHTFNDIFNTVFLHISTNNLFPIHNLKSGKSPCNHTQNTFCTSIMLNTEHCGKGLFYIWINMADRHNVLEQLHYAFHICFLTHQWWLSHGHHHHPRLGRQKSWRWW